MYNKKEIRCLELRFNKQAIIELDNKLSQIMIEMILNRSERK